MRKLTKYAGIGLLCIAEVIASCNEKKEEPVKINRALIVDSYQIQSDMYGCIIRSSRSIPGWMRTCVSKVNVHVEFYSVTDMPRLTSTIDDSIDSKDVQEYKSGFEKDKMLLEQAGMY